MLVVSSLFVFDYLMVFCVYTDVTYYWYFSFYLCFSNIIIICYFSSYLSTINNIKRNNDSDIDERSKHTTNRRLSDPDSFALFLCSSF